jgi:hypothetical protein
VQNADDGAVRAVHAFVEPAQPVEVTEELVGAVDEVSDQFRFNVRGCRYALKGRGNDMNRNLSLAGSGLRVGFLAQILVPCCQFAKIYPSRQGGEIGRRARLRIWWSNP